MYNNFMMGFNPTSCQLDKQIAKVIELYILPCFHPLKAQVWAIAKIITFALNLVVSACVFNQSKGHQLLLNALTTTITFIANMEAKL